MIFLCLIGYFAIVYFLSVVLAVVDYFGENDEVSQIILHAGEKVRKKIKNS